MKSAFTRTSLPALPGQPELPDRPAIPESTPATLGNTWRTLTDTFLSDYRGATRRSYRDAFSLFADFCGVDFESTVTRVPDEDAVKAYREFIKASE